MNELHYYFSKCHQSNLLTTNNRELTRHVTQPDTSYIS